MKTEGKNSICISVGELVRFSSPAGDIDLRRGAGFVRIPDGERRGSDDDQNSKKGIKLEHTFVTDGLSVTVSGTAGRISLYDGTLTAETVRIIRGEPSEIDDSVHNMLFAEAETYGFLYLQTNKAERADIVLTYISTTSGRKFRSVRHLSAGELDERANGLLERAMPFFCIAYEIREKVPAQLYGAAFPFESKRSGQKDLVKRAYETFVQGKRLFAEAPTGTGKTICALFPALKAVATGHADKVFYFCAKSTIVSQAIEAAESLGSRDMRIISLSARGKMCSSAAKPVPGRSFEACNPDRCTAARGHYNRSREALLELLSNHRIYTSELISETAARFRVCPYELSLDLSEFCTVVICDYNYLFSPQVRLRRYFGGKTRQGTVFEEERYLFLIDEAHNLVSRGREMFSAEVSSFAELPLSCGKAVTESAERMNEALRELSETAGESSEVTGPEGIDVVHRAGIVPELPEKFVAAVECFRDAVSVSLLSGCKLTDELYEKYSAAESFLDLAHSLDNAFSVFAEAIGGKIKCRIICLDPSRRLSECMGMGQSAMLFSATLSPMDYYINVLSGPGSAESEVIDSPFPAENLGVFVADRFSTRFTDRETSLNALADMVAAAVGAKKGNYIAFFPSYSYMESVFGKFRKRYPNVNSVIQSRNSSIEDRRRFLSSFSDDG
ncbi:MAG: DEAD/DEAH box helicase, partial [Clostridia bacterium]|nr:DEAD/DEAH box helicase [Clostridia bacterium]